MARLGRYFLPGQPLHVIQHGNNRAPIFFHPEDHARYRDWLALVHDHPLYRALSGTAAERQKAYRALFRVALGEEFLGAVRAPANGGWALGGGRFKRRIEKLAGRRAAPLAKGRPAKSGIDKRQLNLL
jgi:hypothetical protein